jgi:hypothetical protein
MTLVIRSPEASQEAQDSLPSSTDPCNAEPGRNKRKRRATEKFTEAVDRGFIQGGRLHGSEHLDRSKHLDTSR